MPTPVAFKGGIRCCMVLFCTAANPRCSLATHLPRWHPHLAGPCGGTLLFISLIAFVVAIVFMFESGLLLLVLRVVRMLAATRRGAGVFGGFVGVLHRLLSDWARACF